MGDTNEEPSSNAAKVLHMKSTVKQLQAITSVELNKLLRESEGFTINLLTEHGSLLKVDMEKLAGSLPMHLASVLISSNRDEAMFKYVLCGVRLLHALCDLSSRNSKFEQIFLDDVKVVTQMIEMVFFMLTVLAGYRQEGHAFSHEHLLHSTLVACNLYLLTGFISTQWRDIAQVLLAHPKVDIFMDAAFGSVRVVVRCLETTLVAYNEDISMESNLTAERVVFYLCQQCEASLQLLRSLCQQKLFKEQLLRNKELCGKGGILLLAQSILKLHIQPYTSNRIAAAISRLKAKILSILLSLCEAESISYLDEVASTARSLDLSKSVALEVFDLLKKAFGRNPGHLAADRSHPMGLVQLNAMRLADIFSDDSNFRSYMILCFTEVLTAIISLSHGDFLSCWCSSNLSETEEDASIEYDISAAVGWVLHNTSPDVKDATNLEFNLTPSSMLKASYAHHRTSLFVKFFANLHCFVPNVCEEQERNLFVRKVIECLQMDLSTLLPGFSFDTDAPKVSIASKNLRSLLSHAESLIPNFLNVEDVQLLRVFFGELQSLFTSNGFGRNRVQKTQDGKCEESSWDKFSKLNINECYQGAQSAGGRPLPLTSKEQADLNKKGGKVEGMSENSANPNLEQRNTTAEDTIQGNGPSRQSQVENKGISGKTASGGARDIDKDAHKIETSCSDASSAKGKNVVVHVDNGELSKSNERLKRVGVEENPEDEKIEIAQRKKRKRTIMNAEQVTMIEIHLQHSFILHSSLQWSEKSEKHTHLHSRACVRVMGASLSNLGSNGSTIAPSLGDIPENCVARVFLHLTPPEICNLARLNRAFRGAASADSVWESKLPSNYQHLLRLMPEEQRCRNLSKKDIFAVFSKPLPFDDGNKQLWLDRVTGRVCMSISAKGLSITGIDDRRYWTWVPTEESRFNIVAYLQQIWWFEVDGEVDFPFPADNYTLSFRLHLGRFSKRLGRRVCNYDQTHGWDIKPVIFRLSTSDGQEASSECCLDETVHDDTYGNHKRGYWVDYKVGEFIVTGSEPTTKVRFSMKQIDCTHSKGGLCVDSVFIIPSELRDRKGGGFLK